MINTQNKTLVYPAIPGTFKDGIAIPSTLITTKKPTKVIIIFTQPTNQILNRSWKTKRITKTKQNLPNSKWVPLKQYKQELQKAGYNEQFIKSALAGYKRSKFYQQKGLSS